MAFALGVSMLVHMHDGRWCSVVSEAIFGCFVGITKFTHFRCGILCVFGVIVGVAAVAAVLTLDIQRTEGKM